MLALGMFHKHAGVIGVLPILAADIVHACPLGLLMLALSMFTGVLGS